MGILVWITLIYLAGKAVFLILEQMKPPVAPQPNQGQAPSAQQYWAVQELGVSRLIQFGPAGGSVPAHRHLNPDGSAGGWVADSANIAATCTIDLDGSVYGHANLSGNVTVRPYARVHGNAVLAGTIFVGEGADVGGFARIEGIRNVGPHARMR